MTMAISTGERRAMPCPGCGLVVEHTGVAFVSGVRAGDTTWKAERHDAPCGLPCLSGGIGMDVIRPMRAAKKRLHETVHGATDPQGRTSCPSCGRLENL